MIMMGAIGTPATCAGGHYTLCSFHGLSQMHAFLDAGIMEKVFHVKQNSPIWTGWEREDHLPRLLLQLDLCRSLLPPFGAFIGKWFSIETLGALAVNERILGAVVIAG
jgi:hypothetical protein